jgi:hypothetical protein
MAGVTNLQISGTKSGLPFGTESIGPLAIVNGASGDAITDLSSASGNNTITVPGAMYVGCIISPPPGNATAIILKGVAGDTGIPLHLTNPTVLSIPAGTTSFVLNVAGTAVAITILWF